MENIQHHIIPAVLAPGTLLAGIENICKAAHEHGNRRICVPPLFIKHAGNFLADSLVSIATVIGFPYGYSAVEAKVAEIVLAIIDGAGELDIVINLAALKNNDWQYLAHELNTILALVKSKQKVIKIVIEAALLTDDELIKCCDLYGIAGVDFIVLGTGTNNPPAMQQLALVRAHLAEAVSIVVAGQKNNDTFATEMLVAGATLVQLC